MDATDDESADDRHGLRAVRGVRSDCADAPAAAVVVPSVFVAVRDDRGQLLLVHWPASVAPLGQARGPTSRRPSTPPGSSLPKWPRSPKESGARLLIRQALTGAHEPHLDRWERR
jgi:hypothetical protein